MPTETTRAPGSDVQLRIEGMTCASCVARVESALSRVPGVEHARVNLATETATVRTRESLAPESLLTAVRSAGYGAAPLGESRADESGPADRQAQKLSEVHSALIAAVGIGVPIMILHLLDHRLSHGEHGSPGWPLHLQAVLSVLLLASPAGRPILAGGARAIMHRSPNMDLLISLGVLAAVIGSIAGMWIPSLHNLDHFHEAAMILGFINVGRLLEVRARGRASSALAALIRRAPRMALRMEGDHPSPIPIEAVRVGDRLQVAAENYVPVDAVVREGAAAVDASMWTGESLPIEVRPDDKVLGGSYVQSGAMTVEATAVGSQSAMARIIKLVEEAQTSKTDLQRLADRVAGVFVPIAVGLAALTLAGWLLIGGPEALTRGLSAMVAVLVVACPCAMGLATPTAVMVATGSAALRGIIVRDAAALERAGRADTVFLDKTGTLTTGRPRVAEIFASDGIPEREILQLAASAEQFSPHPLAKAIVAHARERGLTLSIPTTYEAEAGLGVRATLQQQRVFVGKADAAGEPAAGDQPTRTPATRVAVLREGQLLGTITLSDSVRDSAADTVKRLKAMDVHPVLLTGDREETARAVATAVGIDDVEAGVTPAGKSERVRARQSAGRRVIMVGDGINDAPALAAADVGIALAGGTEVAGETAHIMLVGDRLELLPEAVALARRSARVIRQNLFWAFAYNAVAIPLAALAVLPAAYAAAAMMFSSLSVVLNSLRLQRWARA